MWKTIIDFQIDTLGSPKISQISLNGFSRNGLVAQGTCAKGFIIGATISGDTTAPESNSSSAWGGKEKWEQMKKHLSVYLISLSTDLLSPTGHKEKANGSQPKL